MTRDSEFNSDCERRRAVTPVVGLVLVVAITVMLAGTAAAFLITMSDDEMRATPPTFAVDFADEDASGGDELRITHESGEAVDPENLVVHFDGVACDGGTIDENRPNVADDVGFTDVFSGGKSFVVESDDVCDPSDELDLSSGTVSLVWLDQDGSTHTIGTWHAG